jgi:hypothetical protein
VTSASPSSDSTSTLRKTGVWNSCKNLRAIQRSDQKLRPFRTGTVVSRAETSASPSSDSTSTAWKTACENSCKNLRAIQRSDQKLRHLQTGTLVSRAETSASPSSDSTSTARKTEFETLVKICGRSNGQIKSYGPFEPVRWSRALRPPPHRVAIPHQLKENGVRKLL